MTPSTTLSPRRRLPVQGADLRGLARLGVDAVVGITNLVEHMHHTIAQRAGLVGPGPEGPPRGTTRGITGFVYRSVRGTTRAAGLGLDAALALLARPTGPSTPEREALLAALNGVWGDHLADSANPLAIRMALRQGGMALAGAPPQATGKLLLLVHGLCMNDLQWHRQGHDHGQALARELGYTPLYLHYNSGRHVSQNGREFEALLRALTARWPVPLDEIVIVGHSMGGLVARAACHVAQERAGTSAAGGVPADWLKKLKALVFLGTPHHGAPLERGGRLLDALLGVSPYVAPFTRLGKARSAGITDLRFGNIQDADWQQHAQAHAQHRDDRLATPLPAGVAAYAVAATTGDKATGLHSKIVGDGLVPVASALGEHRRPTLALHLPPERQKVVTQANHWDLLSREDVYAQLREWLK